MFKKGKWAQVTKEMQRYGFSILGVSEMRWNSCGNMMTAMEDLVYSAMDEVENHERGLGLMLSKDAV